MSSLTAEMPSLLILSNGVGTSDHESLVLQALAESGDLCLVDGLQSLAEDKEVGPEIPMVVGEELVDSSAERVDLGLEDGVCVWIHACACMCMCMYMHVLGCVCVCACACMY